MRLMPTCREARERLTDYTEGTLTFRERLSLRFHLLICTACATFYRGLRSLPGVARFLLGPEPSAEAGQALEAALRQLRGHRHP